MAADKRVLLLQMDYSFPLTPLQAFQVRTPFCARARAARPAER
eukprot:COSAG04_NODE_607_length_12104_cov_5.753853_16_plen_43_part_00